MFLRGVQVRGRRLPGLGPEKASCRRVRRFSFFEDGLPPPTLNDSRSQPIDEDEPTTQPALDHTTEPTTLPAASDPPAPTLTIHGLTHDNGPTTTPHPRIMIHLPERLMIGQLWNAETNSMSTTARRPDYPARSTRSGLMHKWWWRHAHFR